MTVQDRDEVRDLLHDILSVHLSRVEAQNTILDNRLKHIDDKLHIANGRTGKNERWLSDQEAKIRDLEEMNRMHIVSCPIIERVAELEAKNSVRSGIKHFLADVGKTIISVLTILSIIGGLYLIVT